MFNLEFRLAIFKPGWVRESPLVGPELEEQSNELHVLNWIMGRYWYCLGRKDNVPSHFVACLGSRIARDLKIIKTYIFKFVVLF